MKTPTKKEIKEMERRLEYNPEGCTGCFYLVIAGIAIALIVLNFI